MAQKRVHKPNKDQHNEKASREFLREQQQPEPLERDTATGESLQHRSVKSAVENGDNQQKGEPDRPGHVTPKGPMPLQNR